MVSSPMFAPKLTPETTTSGTKSSSPVTARCTQSVGVPLTKKKPLGARRTESGRSSVSELEAPERSRSGATTVTSPRLFSASASSVMPGAKYPSSFETRIRTRGFYGLFTALRLAQPGDRHRLLGKAAQASALVAREHLEVLVRDADVEPARDQRDLEARPRGELLEIDRGLVLLDAEDRPRGIHADQHARLALAQRHGGERLEELARLVRGLALEQLRAQVILVDEDVVAHARNVPPPPCARSRAE